MAHFYGWAHDSIMSLDYEDFQRYLVAIEAIEAQSILSQILVSDFPHYKPEQRKKIIKDINRKAYPYKQSKRPLDAKSFVMNLMKDDGNG